VAKKIVNQVKLLIQAGDAKPAPPVGPALGAAGVSIPLFIKDFNARTAHMKAENIAVPSDIHTPPTPLDLRRFCLPWGVASIHTAGRVDDVFTC